MHRGFNVTEFFNSWEDQGARCLYRRFLAQVGQFCGNICANSAALELKIYRISGYFWTLFSFTPCCEPGFPLGLEKVGRHFPLREKSGNFEKGKSHKILKKSRSFRQMLFIIF